MPILINVYNSNNDFERINVKNNFSGWIACRDFSDINGLKFKSIKNTKSIFLLNQRDEMHILTNNGQFRLKACSGLGLDEKHSITWFEKIPCINGNETIYDMYFSFMDDRIVMDDNLNCEILERVYKFETNKDIYDMKVRTIYPDVGCYVRMEKYAKITESKNGVKIKYINSPLLDKKD